MIHRVLEVLMAPKKVPGTPLVVSPQLQSVNGLLQQHYSLKRQPNNNRYEIYELFKPDYHHKMDMLKIQKDISRLQNTLMNDLTYELKQYNNYDMLKPQNENIKTLPMKYGCTLQQQISNPPSLPIVPILMMQPNRVSIPSRFQQDALMNIHSLFKQQNRQLLLAAHKIFRSNFDRLQCKKQVDLRLIDRKVSQNMQKIPKFDVPKFRQLHQDMLVLPVSNKILDALYESTLYLLERHFALQMCQLIYSRIHIRLDEPVSLNNVLVNNTDASYYAHKKNILFVEFIEEMHDEIANMKEGHQTTMQGLLMPIKGQEMFAFSPRQNEPQSKLSRKVNTNQFEKMEKIACGEMALLVQVHDEDNMHMCCIREMNPIKIYCPTLKITDTTLFRFIKVANRKVFDRVSNAISNVSRKNMAVMNQSNVHLVMMYPGTGLNMVVQMVLEWLKGGHSVLVTGIDIDEAFRVLLGAGINCFKVVSSTDQKTLVATKAQVVCSNIKACASDCFKNQNYSRVVILQANSITQTLSLLALSKGCRKAVLVGDQQLPGARVSSLLSRSKGGNISLFERLLKQGYVLTTYNEHSILDPSIISMISPTFYQGKLKIAQKLNVSPKIKGFPWPSNDMRLCIVHQTQSDSHVNAQSAQMAIRIWASVLQAGFTDIKQMLIGTTSKAQYEQIRYLLAYYMQVPHLLWQLRHSITKQEWNPQMLNNMCCLPQDQQGILKDFIVISTNNDLNQRDLISFMSRVKRGIVIVADLNKINRQSTTWHNLLNWAYKYRLILQSDIAQNSNC